MIRDGRALRLSFSKSLCDHIAEKVIGAKVERVGLRVGGELPPGRTSGNGLYAVCKKNGWPLRVTMFQELADKWRHESRVVRECWIERDG